MMSPKIAQILRFGADDTDGTNEEKIYHDAGATTPQGMQRGVGSPDLWGRQGAGGTRYYWPVTRTETP
jgi:aminodeoxyfutalosine synthase